MFDAKRFLDDYSIQYIITEGHKHSRPGWIQIKCPFCNSREGWHLGFNLEGDYWHCWRCEWHSTIDVVCALLNCEKYQAHRTIQCYQSSILTKNNTIIVRKNNTARLPEGAGRLLHCHRKYLRDRGFDDLAIKELIDTWGILGTGPIGEWKFRIIIPVRFNGILVSFITRAISQNNPLRYKNCPRNLEVMSIKNTLYGYDQVKRTFGKDLVIVTEGVFDAWKLGPGAVATYGVNYSAAQLNLLAEFKHIAILFDNDPAGQRRADNLAADLNNLGRRTIVITLDEKYKDAGDMPISEARSLMYEIFSFFLDEKKFNQTIQSNYNIT